MKEVIKKDGKVFKMWVDYSRLDELAKQQIEDISKVPYVQSPVHIMADAHGGYGVPIGTVLKTKGRVIPSAVGNDIGCGMTCFVINKSPNNIDWERFLEVINLMMKQNCQDQEMRMNLLEAGYIEPVKTAGVSRYISSYKEDGRFSHVRRELYKKAEEHFGTIGGGNHFIEAGETDDGRVYILVHSGSRGLGSIVNVAYGSIACDFSEAVLVDGFNKDLASLPVSPDLSEELSSIGKDYLTFVDMLSEWATENRICIANRIMCSMFGAIENSDVAIVDCTHNFAKYDVKTDTVTHYKGANKTSSNVIIAGSSGTKSHIVQYKRNLHGFFCSHGAGRDMSRTVAKGCITQDEADKSTSHVLQNSNPIDECPLAYKNIDVVMDAQSDLVRVIMTLYPKISFK